MCRTLKLRGAPVSRPSYFLTNRRRLALQFLDKDARDLLQSTLWASVNHDNLVLEDIPRAKALGRLTKAIGFDGGAYLAKSLKRRVQSTLSLLEAFD